LKTINHSVFFSRIFSVAVFLGIVVAECAFAGASHNVSGYAWSGVNPGEDAIGHISFNNANYGVHICINETDPVCSDVASPKIGAMKGYAWAGVGMISGVPTGIGYVSFNSADLTNCPNGSCKAWVTTVQDGQNRYWLNGWARVKAIADDPANSGGWLGWIHLNYYGACDTDNDRKSEGPAAGAGCPAVDIPVYGVYYHANDSEGRFHGFAYSEELGWISLNCDNQGCQAGKEYWVKTTAKFGPKAVMGCGGTCPGGYCGEPKWILYPATGCEPCAFQFQNISEPAASVQCSHWQLTGPASYGYTAPSPGLQNIQLSAFGEVVPGEYNLTLTVSDMPISGGNNQNCTLGNSNTSAARSVQVKREAQAKFVCSLDNPVPTVEVPVPDPYWEDCGTLEFKKKVIKDEIIYVKDNGSIWSQDATKINNWKWTFTIDSMPQMITKTSADDAVSFTAGKTNTIDLKVSDNNSRSGCKGVTISAKSLPKWHEVSPVSMIRPEFVAAVANFLGTL